MGNCFQPMPSSPRQERAKVVIFNGGEEEFMASTTVEQVISGHFSKYQLVHLNEPCIALPPHYQLVAGETYYLMPSLIGGPCRPPFSQRINGDDCPAAGDDWIKVVLPNEKPSEDQFQVQKILAKEISVLVFGSSWTCTGSYKAQPDLQVIPESSTDR